MLKLGFFWGGGACVREGRISADDDCETPYPSSPSPPKLMIIRKRKKLFTTDGRPTDL